MTLICHRTVIESNHVCWMCEMEGHKFQNDKSQQSILVCDLFDLLVCDITITIFQIYYVCLF